MERHRAIVAEEQARRKPKDNRRILNAISWVLRWRIVARSSRTGWTLHHGRWRKTRIWDGLMDAIVKPRDGKVQMIDTLIARVHQHASGPQKKWRSLCEPKLRRVHHMIHARRREEPSGLPPNLAGRSDALAPW